MITIEEVEERSIIKKNRKTVMSMRSGREEIQNRAKLLKDKSQMSMKQRSLDEAELKKTKLHPQKTKKKLKLNKPLPKEPIKKRTTDRQEIKNKFSAPISYVRSNVLALTAHPKSPGLPPKKKQHSPSETTRPKIVNKQTRNERNITLNDDMLRIFQETQSRIVDPDEISIRQCQVIHDILNKLSDLPKDKKGISQEIICLSNTLAPTIRHFRIWKWLYSCLLVTITVDLEDEEALMNVNNMITYVRSIMMIHVENLAQMNKASVKVIVKLKGMLKKQTKSAERHIKLDKNTEIVKSLIGLLCQSHQIMKIIQLENEDGFVQQFFRFWRQRQLIPYLPPIKNKKLTLCLDLDETLIYFDRAVGKLLIRPHVKEFLERMAVMFELVVFTASLKEYADYMIDQLDTKKLIKYRLYRQNCSSIVGRQRKDLSKLGRDIEKTFIVDNLEDNYLLQPRSGLAVSSWFGDPNDRELLQLANKLQKMVEKM